MSTMLIAVPCVSITIPHDTMSITVLHYVKNSVAYVNHNTIIYIHEYMCQSQYMYYINQSPSDMCQSPLHVFSAPDLLHKKKIASDCCYHMEKEIANAVEILGSQNPKYLEKW